MRLTLRKWIHRLQQVGTSLRLIRSSSKAKATSQGTHSQACAHEAQQEQCNSGPSNRSSEVWGSQNSSFCDPQTRPTELQK
jgi:hypothetical protein